MNGNVYNPHPLMLSSGEFWRCDHGLTGLGDGGTWRGCIDCAETHIKALESELAAMRERAAEQDRQLSAARDEAMELRKLHDNGIREAYRICGVEDDGEYRWKWVLLELANLRERAEKAFPSRDKFSAYADDWWCRQDPREWEDKRGYDFMMAAYDLVARLREKGGEGK